LTFVRRCGLANTDVRRLRNGSRHLLVKHGVDRFAREGQVLDRGPTGDQAELTNVVVRLAGGALEAPTLLSEPGLATVPQIRSLATQL
jgi:hypothetical protein